LVKQLDEFYAKPEEQTEDVFLLFIEGIFLVFHVEFGR